MTGDLLEQVCTFYQKGTCAYGSLCRYDHVKVPQQQASASSSAYSYQYAVSESVSATAVTREVSAPSRPYASPAQSAWGEGSGENDLFNDVIGQSRSTNPSDIVMCSFAAAGNCPRGENCPHVHGDLCPTCRKQCLHPFRPDEREEHKRNCEKKHKHLEALKHSQEIECSVCLERVFSKPTAERKFGLLSECDHPFCISCIRNWRSSSPTSGMDVNSALRSCPICRKLSYFVIPSVIWYATKEEKQEIVDSYKAKLRYGFLIIIIYLFGTNFEQVFFIYIICYFPCIMCIGLKKLT